MLLHGEHSWDFLQDLKQDPATQDIPVYVITVVDNREKALSLGADGFHANPVDRVWLLDQLHGIARPNASAPILIIDDDETSRYLVKTLLASSDCEVLEASGGTDGLRLVHEAQLALIVLDLAMPDLSGFDVLEDLRRELETNRVPVVIIHTSKVLEMRSRST